MGSLKIAGPLLVSAGGGEHCCICLEAYGQEGHEKAYQLPCQHFLHPTCMLNHCLASTSCPRCPLCRAPAGRGISSLEDDDMTEPGDEAAHGQTEPVLPQWRGFSWADVASHNAWIKQENKEHAAEVAACLSLTRQIVNRSRDPDAPRVLKRYIADVEKAASELRQLRQRITRLRTKHYAGPLRSALNANRASERALRAGRDRVRKAHQNLLLRCQRSRLCIKYFERRPLRRVRIGS